MREKTDSKDNKKLESKLGKIKTDSVCMRCPHIVGGKILNWGRKYKFSDQNILKTYENLSKTYNKHFP